MHYPVVYDQYLKMVSDILERYSANIEDSEKILDHLKDMAESKSTALSGGETLITLHVEKPDYPIHWENKGRIFEIVGTNLRNKTTTLIYISTLLGFDWEAAEPYIEDKKMIKQSKVIMREISNGVSATLVIDNSNYRFEVIVKDSISNVVRWNKLDSEHLSLQDISLSSELDWKEYRSKLGNFFDVQVVGVGRNFVTQVGHEEASNLALFCEEASKYITHYTQLLNSKKPKISPKLLQVQINDLKQKISGVTGEHKQLTELLNVTRVNHSQLIKEHSRIVNILEKDEVKTLLKLSLEKTNIEFIFEKIKANKIELEQLEELQKEYEDIISKQTQDFDSLHNEIALLKESIESIKESLIVPDNILKSFINALNNNDITNIRLLGKALWVDEKTYEAHHALANYSFSGISLKTKLLGIEVFSGKVENLSELKNKMEESESTTKELSKLTSNFERVFSQLNKLNYNTTEKYLSDLEGITKLNNLINGLREQIRSIKIELDHLERSYQEKISPYVSIDELRKRYDAASTVVKEEDLVQIDEICGNYDLRLDFSLKEELENIINGKHSLIKETELKLADLRRAIEQLRQRKKKLEQEYNTIEHGGDLEQRTIPLIKTKDLLGNISEYFIHKRKFFESNDANILAKLEKDIISNEQNLGNDFDKVIDLINERIKDRCPFAFVNTETGIEERSVLRYDFLESDFFVDGLPESAKFHGGITSSMTVYGLATKRTGAELGSILLVDEWGDVGVYKDSVYQALCKIEYLTTAIFVDVDEDKKIPELRARR
ncbi:hypothetical protein IAQ67_20825 [Paenibacillus peoriae]|uniref:Uncharacterized protein n=1 Tax=Paenibacillus peoriae TaxID=59893 RepID=A0A7H0Y5A7_9BACL|nr:hypothetical protein [Paenibacillus peoriae]QNR66265.1 hypothetical protein IAQ67_20825 [Paenibacillus peoriae]